MSWNLLCLRVLLDPMPKKRNRAATLETKRKRMHTNSETIDGLVDERCPNDMTSMTRS